MIIVTYYDFNMYIINHLILTYCIGFILFMQLFFSTIFKNVIVICINRITKVSTRQRQIYVLV